MLEWQEIVAVLVVAVSAYTAGYLRSNSVWSTRRWRESQEASKQALAHLDALEKLINNPKEDAVARFVDNQMTFNNYVKTEPDAPGPRMTPAALIEQDAVEHVRKYWGLKDAQVGMYLLLHPNGNGTLMTESNFKARFTKAHTTAE